MKELIQQLAICIEFTGVGIIVLGALYSFYIFFRQFLKNSQEAYELLRRTLGRSILLGLEFLVAGDIINTVAIEPSVESVAVLGGIVLIRTFLSFSLEIELEKRLPWK